MSPLTLIAVLLALTLNGVGIATGAPADALPGQGVGIVKALARQLRARVERSAGPGGAGTSVFVGDGAGPVRAARGQAPFARPYKSMA